MFVNYLITNILSNKFLNKLCQKGVVWHE